MGEDDSAVVARPAGFLFQQFVACPSLDQFGQIVLIQFGAVHVRRVVQLALAPTVVLLLRPLLPAVDLGFEFGESR